MKRHLTAAIHILQAFCLRNKIILSDISHPAIRKSVNLNWWNYHIDHHNIGDYLSPVVVSYMKSYYGVDKRETASKTKHLYAIGSIIDGGYQDAVIWGSGLLRGKERYWWRNLRKLDVRCVRGPETRQKLISNGYKCPEIYGDPAILLPRIYQPAKKEILTKYRVIPHMAYGTDYPRVLNPLTVDWQSFIDEIVSSERIISSSLHGIILAESYGIPAVLLNDHNMNLFKYADYYHSTGRYEFPAARTVEEALHLKPADIPDFSEMQENLIRVFPYDLWDYNL